MIYNTPRKVLCGLLEGKTLKSATELYNMYSDTYTLRYIRMLESGGMEVYDQKDEVWLEEDARVVYARTDWVEEEPPVTTKTISINGVEFPEPEKEPPECDTFFYIPVLHDHNLYYRITWTPVLSDLLKKGLVHLTKEGAIAQAQALLNLIDQAE